MRIHIVLTITALLCMPVLAERKGWELTIGSHTGKDVSDHVSVFVQEGKRGDMVINITFYKDMFVKNPPKELAASLMTADDRIRLPLLVHQKAPLHFEIRLRMPKDDRHKYKLALSVDALHKKDPGGPLESTMSYACGVINLAKIQPEQEERD